MSKTMIVGGYGTGISKAIAKRFGAEGFSLIHFGQLALKPATVQG